MTPLPFREGFCKLALPPQRIAKVAMSLGMIGLETDRLTVLDDRLLQLELGCRALPRL